MGLKFSKQDKIEEVRIQQLPSSEDREAIAEVLVDEPENPIANLDWGVYLAHVDKNYNDAEQYFAYAIELDKYNAKCIGFYALFLELEKKDIERAGAMYKKGYEEIICKIQILGDDEVNFMCNYAIFQRNALNNPEKADELYRKLIASNPKHAIAHGDYGILLKDGLKDYERADHHLKKAAELAPDVAHWQLAYGKFLKSQKNEKAAKPYLDAAKELKKLQRQKEKESVKKEREKLKKEKKDKEKEKEKGK